MKQIPPQMPIPGPAPAQAPVIAANQMPSQMHAQPGYPAPRPMPAPQAASAPMPRPQAPAQAMPSQAMPAPQMPPVPQAAPPQLVPQAMHGQVASSAGHIPVAAVMPPAAQIEDERREGGEKSLPQISIHAFCDRNETAGTINETTRDWRMKRTNVKIYMGGLLAAIEYYRKENTPNLILIESGMRGAELFSQLEDLASVCDAETKVVVIGAANDIRLYRQLMEKGVSEYLVPPFHPLTLIRSLGDLYSDPDKPFVGRTAAFFGAKGGVGSSTLAHNIAWCMAEVIQQDTALVDLDASWGTTGLDFAYDASQGLEEALAEPERLDETLLDRIMLRHTAKLSILPTAGSLTTKVPTLPDAYEAVVNAVRGMSPMAILDMPHFWADWTTKVLTSADDVVITATPDLANLRNTKNLIDFLKSQRPNDIDPILILNKTGLTKNNEITVKDFAAAVGLEPALVIGFDPDSFTEAANDGKMLTDIKSASQTVSGLTYIAQRLKTGEFSSSHSERSGGKGLSFLKRGGKDTVPKAGKAEKAKGISILSKLKKK